MKQRDKFTRDVTRRIQKVFDPAPREVAPSPAPRVVKTKPCTECVGWEYEDRRHNCRACNNTRLVPDKSKTLFFPIGRGGLMVGAVSNSDGTPLSFKDGIPVYGKYYLYDEFETPILDAKLCAFFTPDECRFVAMTYLLMVEQGVDNPDAELSMLYAGYVHGFSPFGKLDM